MTINDGFGDALSVQEAQEFAGVGKRPLVSAAYQAVRGQQRMDVEDLVQEGLIAVWQAIEDDQPPAIAAFRAKRQMNRVAQRHLFTGQPVARGGGSYRDPLRSDTWSWDSLMEDLDQPRWLGYIEHAYHTGDLGRALSDLSQKQRYVVYAIFWRRDTYAEIASDLGLRPKTVINMWHDDIKPLLRERLAHLVEAR